jgi:hypothetical protein
MEFEFQIFHLKYQRNYNNCIFIFIGLFGSFWILIKSTNPPKLFYQCLIGFGVLFISFWNNFRVT